MPTKRKTYTDGWEVGYSDRGRETVLHGTAPWTFWHWGDWAVYVGSTLLMGGVLLLFFFLFGIFIRWEVGPIVVPAASIPFTLNQGWMSSECYIPNVNKMNCEFWKE